MDIRRFKDIIAVKTGASVNSGDSITAFHSMNLEVAEISEESFNEMTPIDVLVGELPDLMPIRNLEAREAMDEWSKEYNPNVKDGKLEFGIRSLAINVNQICNLKCAYCAAGGDGTYGAPSTQISVEKTLPQLKYFLSSLKENSKFAISFIGGEPLLHPLAIAAIYDFVVTESKAKNARPSFGIVTNGTLFSDETLSIIRRLKINITVSLDGVKEKNDLVRPAKNGKSSTEMTLDGLRKLASDRGDVLSVGIAAVCSTGNDDILTNYNFLKSLNPDWMEFNIAYSEKSVELQEKYISQMIKIAEIAWNNGGEKELRKLKIFNHYFRMLDAQQRVENHCGAGKSYLAVDSKNTLYPCHWFIGKKDEIAGKGEQLNPDILANYSKSLVELNNCNSCWAKTLCGGGCMYIHSEHTGSKHKKDILFCERTRSLILTSLLYYKRARSAEQ